MGHQKVIMYLHMFIYVEHNVDIKRISRGSCYYIYIYWTLVSIELVKYTYNNLVETLFLYKHHGLTIF